MQAETSLPDIFPHASLGWLALPSFHIRNILQSAYTSYDSWDEAAAALARCSRTRCRSGHLRMFALDLGQLAHTMLRKSILNSYERCQRALNCIVYMSMWASVSHLQVNG